MTFGSKTPMMWNLCTGQIGSFIGTIPVESEKNYVKIIYVPINSWKKKISDESYPREAIVRVTPDNMKLSGVFKDYVLITENGGGKSPFFDKVSGIKIDRIAKYREEARDQELAAVQQKYRAKEAKEESSKQIARDLELTEKRDRRKDRDELFGLSGRYGKYRQYADNDQY